MIDTTFWCSIIFFTDWKSDTSTYTLRAAPSKAFLVIFVLSCLLCDQNFSSYFLIPTSCKGFSDNISLESKMGLKTNPMKPNFLHKFILIPVTCKGFLYIIAFYNIFYATISRGLYIRFSNIDHMYFPVSNNKMGLKSSSIEQNFLCTFIPIPVTCKGFLYI